MTSPAELDLMPWPAHVAPVDAEPWPAGAALSAVFEGSKTVRLQAAADRLVALTGAGGGAAERPLVIRCGRDSPRYPALDDDEGYLLELDARGARITAAEEWGALRALATLTQLMTVPPAVALAIDDRPRFAWRGLMLDTARHFLPLRDLLRTLDAMAVFKLNVLHLHLSDDQAVRFPSRRYPRLASGEHYSREDLANLVEHAADLGIRVVPELDVPGHATAWLVAYPEWGSGHTGPSRRFGVHQACLDPTRDEVVEALDELFAELAEVFPDAYLHLGGDEVHPAWWSEDVAIRRHMAGHDLREPADLQARLNGHLTRRIAGLGRRALGWDEVVHESLGPEITVQAWRGATARDRALLAGHDCVLSAPYYLDLFYPAGVHYRFDPAAPEAGLLAEEDALLEDPRLVHVARGMAWTHQWREHPPAVPAERPGRLLGAEACLWSELVDARVLDIRLWSRMPALAERFWSPPDVDGEDGMYRRLVHVVRQLDRWAGVDVAGSSGRLLTEAGVASSWHALTDMLEPVKWYGRLLGEQALTARLAGREMPQARPYDADTPLDRVADALPPESHGARAVAVLARAERRGDEQARRDLTALARSWRDLPAAGAGPRELEPAAAALKSLGDIVLAVLEGELTAAEARERVAPLAAPYGEYLLAPVPWLLEWLEQRPGSVHGR